MGCYIWSFCLGGGCRHDVNARNEFQHLGKGDGTVAINHDAVQIRCEIIHFKMLQEAIVIPKIVDLV